MKALAENRTAPMTSDCARRKRGAAAGKTITGKTAAGRARPILGDSAGGVPRRGRDAFGKRRLATGWALELCAADSRFAIHLAERPSRLCALFVLDSHGVGRAGR